MPSARTAIALGCLAIGIVSIAIGERLVARFAAYAHGAPDA